MMTSYFARPPRRKAMHWKATAPARLPVKSKRNFKTEEHDAQVRLFKERITGAAYMEKRVESEFTRDRPTFPQTFPQCGSESLREY
jgi:hypothetical protein